jgi:uncharacterized membrane protein YeaQ/YmgE (transglycosylase-associated protein family)
MHLIGSIIIGFVVGILARLIMPGKDAMGMILTVLLGIAGSVIATFLGRAAHLYGPDEPAGFIASIVGALIVLGLYNMFRGKRTGGTVVDRDRWAA